MKRARPDREENEYKKKKKKKKKRSKVKQEETSSHSDTETLPVAVAEAAPVERQYTVAIALPGSIIDNAQSPELKTYLAGQLARAAVIFNIDEVIVFDEQGSSGQSSSGRKHNDPNVFLARLLQYLETPQYLRKALFPMHPDLRLVGILNPLDCPHHMRQEDPSQYREGVVLDKPVKPGSKSGSYVNCGLRKDVRIDKQLKPGVRVTVRLSDDAKEGKNHRGKVVSPSAPKQEAGLYWGYTVRLASSFGAVFTEAPHKDGYDMVIGTSERGDSIDTLGQLPSFKNLLVVFGGLKGLEYSLECDEGLQINDVSLLFHHYLNVCPQQGSRTIRTEEAVLIALSSLRPLVAAAGV